jgi:hypothetical protein
MFGWHNVEDAFKVSGTSMREVFALVRRADAFL